MKLEPAILAASARGSQASTATHAPRSLASRSRTASSSIASLRLSASSGWTLPAAKVFGEAKARLAAAGKSIANADIWIASVALARGGIVVTGNARHLARVPGLKTEEWIH
jgi:predicted nucleic acid-binding protein